MPLPFTTQRSLPPMRGSGLPIGAWLVLGFAVVIGALVTSGVVALRSTRHATVDVARVQHDFEPLTRRARDLGEMTAAFDRSVLAYLRSDSANNRAAVANSAARLASVVNWSMETDATRKASTTGLLLSQVARHQTDGFRLLEMQDERRRIVTELEQAYTDLDRRITNAGGRGLTVGDSILARPSLIDLAKALEVARNEAARALARGVAAVEASTPGETAFRDMLQRHGPELARSPGAAWLDFVREDFSRAIKLRRRALQLDADIEARRTTFTARGDALATEIRENVEAPAWQELREAAEGAKAAVETAEQTIHGATVKAVLLTVLALLVTAWTITWPVRRLTAGTRRLAAGDLSTRVRRGGASELDELAQVFNHMAEELDSAGRAVRAYQSQLEQRVEERTLQLRHLADHDPLTNLPNRRQLFQRLNEMIEGADPASDHLAVLFLDLDNFKTVNDSLGHEFGDRVLTEIGERLRLLSDETGFIARLGGDEFTLLFHFSGTAEAISSRAERLVASFQRPLVVDRREIAIGVSCGAAVYPEHGRDATSLLRAADAALFRAKELGRNQLCVYDPGLLAAASNRFRVEQALRKAIEGGDFVLHYQPQVCLARQRTVTVEALLRWRKSDTQIVPAGEFISIAEQSGLMLDLNDWVIEEAAHAVGEWRRNGWPDARVAVNVSAQQFISGDFIGDLGRLLDRHGLTPDAIELELTEGVLQTGAITVETLRSLREMGVATSLDDFGTGYSSLTSLEQLPLTRVKLDRSMIADVDANPRAAAIARSIVGLCRSLGLQVTVEGVERASQFDIVAGFGEVSVQGYLVACPTDGAHILEFVDETRARVDALVEAAERGRAALAEEPPGAAISYLRRTRP